MTESALKPGDNLTHVAVALQALRGARTAVVCAIDDAVIQRPPPQGGRIDGQPTDSG